MVYESDFYTVRRPYARPTITSYSVSVPKPIITVRSHLAPIGTPSKVRMSVLMGELNRIQNRPRQHLGYIPTENFLNSRPLVEFDDETKIIRAQADKLMKYIYTRVPHRERRYPIGIISSCDYTPPEGRYSSPNYLTYHRDIPKNVLNMSYYYEPSRATIGRGHLACVSYAGGKGYPKRKHLYNDENRDIYDEIKFRSYYTKIVNPKRIGEALLLPTGFASRLLLTDHKAYGEDSRPLLFTSIIKKSSGVKKDKTHGKPAEKERPIKTYEKSYSDQPLSYNQPHIPPLKKLNDLEDIDMSHSKNKSSKKLKQKSFEEPITELKINIFKKNSEAEDELPTLANCDNKKHEKEKSPVEKAISPEPAKEEPHILNDEIYVKETSPINEPEPEIPNNKNKKEAKDHIVENEDIVKENNEAISDSALEPAQEQESNIQPIINNESPEEIIEEIMLIKPENEETNETLLTESDKNILDEPSLPDQLLEKIENESIELEPAADENLIPSHQKITTEDDLESKKSEIHQETETAQSTEPEAESVEQGTEERETVEETILQTAEADQASETNELNQEEKSKATTEEVPEAIDVLQESAGNDLSEENRAYEETTSEDLEKYPEEQIEQPCTNLDDVLEVQESNVQEENVSETIAEVLDEQSNQNEGADEPIIEEPQSPSDDLELTSPEE